jgi:hypothetical protein
MDDEVKMTITIRGVRNHPSVTENVITTALKRALYSVGGIPGEFGARIDGPCGSIELDENREWQRVRDSNSRGADPDTLSRRAP